MEKGTTWQSSPAAAFEYIACYPTTRVLLAVMVFTGWWLNCMLRVVMASSMFPDYYPHNRVMKNRDTGALINGSVDLTVLKDSQENFTKLDQDSDGVSWTQEETEDLLRSYFWSYPVTAMIGGPVAELFGPKIVVLASMVVGAVLVIITPAAAQMSYSAVYLVRIVTGAAGGFLPPSMQVLIARWVPPAEKGRFLSLFPAGEMIGFIYTWLLSELLVTTSGWSAAFGFHGAVVLMWCLFWYYMVTDTPMKHPRISEEEKDYIIDAIGDKIDYNATKSIPPFLKILTSVPCLGMIVLYFGSAWGFFIMMMYIQTFIKECVKRSVNLLDYGDILSFLPFLAVAVTSIVYGFIADWISSKELLKKTDLRMFFCLFSHILPGLLIFGVGYFNVSLKSPTQLVLLSIIWCCIGAHCVTSLQICQDLAPNYAGTLYGIIYGICIFIDFEHHKLIKSLTFRNYSNCNGWSHVLALAGGVYIAAVVLFFVFGSAQTQLWNYPGGVRPTKDKPKRDPSCLTCPIQG